MNEPQTRQQPALEFTDPQVFRDPQAFWGLILDDLALQMTQVTFATWLQPTRAIAFSDDVLSVRVPNQRVKEWLENRLYGRIQKTVDYFSKDPLEIRFVANDPYPERGGARVPPRRPEQTRQQRAGQMQRQPKPRTHEAQRAPLKSAARRIEKSVK